ncbi:hypothetical protein Scep_022331 [Stephania cephalantha]|uniref:Uncharacterized protein n=1 Tax=Stephania cephalantha TaxID=152367 RepID=A0AAP0F7T8_9MAGN
MAVEIGGETANGKDVEGEKSSVRMAGNREGSEARERAEGKGHEGWCDFDNPVEQIQLLIEVLNLYERL